MLRRTDRVRSFGLALIGVYAVNVLDSLRVQQRSGHLSPCIIGIENSVRPSLFEFLLIRCFAALGSFVQFCSFAFHKTFSAYSSAIDHNHYIYFSSETLVIFIWRHFVLSILSESTRKNRTPY